LDRRASRSVQTPADRLPAAPSRRRRKRSRRRGA
jgi:hypothetical protein